MDDKNIHCLYFLNAFLPIRNVFVPIQNLFVAIQNVFARTSNIDPILLVAGAVQLLPCSLILYIFNDDSSYILHTKACGGVVGIPILFFLQEMYILIRRLIEQFPNHIWKKPLYKRNQRHTTL